MIPVAPRIVNDVSCETRINHEKTLSFVSGALFFVSGASTCGVAWRLDIHLR